MHLKCHLLSVDHFVHALMREITVNTNWLDGGHFVTMMYTDAL